MKLANFKRALVEKTNVPYELLEERFDPEWSNTSSLEDLIRNRNYINQVLAWLCDWNATPEKHSFWLNITNTLRNIGDASIESWPPNKDRFFNTKWDARNWTEDQKSEWQKAMFSLGFTWASGDTHVRLLDSEIYYINVGNISAGPYCDLNSFNSHRYKQMYFEDMPGVKKSQEAASIEVGNPVEAPNKERFFNTKWDARNLTSDQKAEWQEAMFALGFKWATGSTDVIYLNGTVYKIGNDGKLGVSFSYSSIGFNSHKYKQMFFEDLFPAPEAASIEVGNPVEAPNKAPATEEELIALVKSSREYSEEPYILSLAPEGVMVRNDTDMFTIPKSFDLKKLGEVLKEG